ncbi:MAG: RNA pseudouridine synthase [Clostridia bacterium]|nr:RNA pseudouridine synthase [Clostridia bacterium]
MKDRLPIANGLSPVNIIYEDNHLLVVEKPVNIPSQEDETRDPDMLTILKSYIKEKYNKPGEVFLGLVHRLDRPVGGAMVFARTSKAASRLSEQIRSREFKKVYLAVVNGIPAKKQGRLQHYLYKDERTNTVRVVDADYPGAKEAILEYTTLESQEGLSLVRIQLHTGRPHQIRVQFANVGNPLFGDQKYGAGINRAGQQIALWSNRITLVHPTMKEERVFECQPPQSFPWNSFKIVFNV